MSTDTVPTSPLALNEHQPTARRLRRRFHAAALAFTAGLAGCGGGSDDTSGLKAAAESFSMSRIAAASATNATQSDIDRAFLSVDSDGAGLPAPADLKANNSAQSVAASDEAPLPASCATMYLGSLGIRCLGYGEGIATPGSVQGLNASQISAPNLYCPEIPIGQLVYGVTPAVGSMACYQFVVNASATVNYEVVLPAGVSGKVELYGVKTNGSGMTVSRAASPTNPLTGGVTIQYTRMLVSIQTSSGSGGQVFGLGINSTVAQPLPNNSVIANAYSIDMNEEINETLISTTGTAHYFVPLRNGQTTALLTTTFNPSDVQVAYRSAQRISSGVYALGNETIVGAPQANGARLALTSS